MAQRIGQPDLIILGTCFVIALGLAGISQTILAKHASTLGEMMSGIQAKFRDMQQGGSGFPGGGGAPGRAANDDVIEGEFKRKDED